MVGWILVALLLTWVALDRLVPISKPILENHDGAFSSIPVVLVAMIVASFTTSGSLTSIRTSCSVDVLSCCRFLGWIWSVSFGWDVLLAFLIRRDC